MLLQKPLVVLCCAVLMLSACTKETASTNDSEHTADSAAAAADHQADRLQTKFVSIATGGASGPYNIIATTLAEIYNKTYATNSKTQTTGASVENINLMKQKKVEMAFLMSDVLSDAVNGRGSFEQPITNVLQIAALYPNYVQIVTSKKSGINSLTDLRGKRVAVGAQNSGVEVNARTLIEGHGLSYKDMKVDYLGYAESADALKAGKIDAAFLTSGLPNASLLELEKSFDLQLVSIDPQKLAEIAKEKTYFVSLNIPQGTYGNAEDIPTAALKNALVVRSDLTEDDVYKLSKTFFASLPQLISSHQAAKQINLKEAQEGLVAPLHPGAAKYYNEVGTAP